jgi:hypothetical protein
VLSTRKGRLTGWFAGVVAVGGAFVLASAGVGSAAAYGTAQAGRGTQPGRVNLVPPTGPAASTPTWATTVACPAGFQGSAVFSEVHADGTTTNTIAPITNGTAAAFTGTLQASMARIKTAGAIPNGGTQELFITCYSLASGTGTAQPYMNIFVTYSADGSRYTTSTTGPTVQTPSSTTAPTPSPTSPVGSAPTAIPVHVTLPVTG